MALRRVLVLIQVGVVSLRRRQAHAYKIYLTKTQPNKIFLLSKNKEVKIVAKTKKMIYN